MSRNKKRNPKRICYAEINGHRANLSMIGFEMISTYSKPIGETRPDDIAEIACRIVNGVTAFAAEDSVIELAMKYKWFWSVVLWTDLPGVSEEDRPKVEFKTDGCVQLCELSHIVQDVQTQMGEDFPESTGWGWSARIYKSPV